MKSAPLSRRTHTEGYLMKSKLLLPQTKAGQAAGLARPRRTV